MKQAYLQSLHNHTVNSDGSFSIDQIVERCISADLKIVGISDHYTTFKVMNAVGEDSLEPYLKQIRDAQRKYSRAIKVRAGLEIDTSSGGISMYNFELDKFKKLIPKLNLFDYILMEYVGDERFGSRHSMHVVRMPEFLKHMQSIRNNGLTVPVGLAHTNFVTNFRSDELPYNPKLSYMRMLAKENVFVELCTSARATLYNLRTGAKELYFLLPEFVKYIDHFKKYGGKITIGTDAHDKLDEAVDIGSAVDFVKKQGLVKSLLRL